MRETGVQKHTKLLHKLDAHRLTLEAYLLTESESEVFYLVIFQNQETSAKTTSGRCRRGHLEK